MAGPKKQDFRSRINILKGFFKNSVDELRFVKKWQNCTFKVNFLCKKINQFFSKKKSFQNINLGDHFL